VIQTNERDENSGLWFSPQPPTPSVQGARNPDSVLFDLAKVASTVTAPSATAPRLHAASGSGLIDVRTLAAAARDPIGGAPVAPPLPVGLIPTLAPPTMAPMEHAAPGTGGRPVLYAIVALLFTLVALLGYLAVGNAA